MFNNTVATFGTSEVKAGWRDTKTINRYGKVRRYKFSNREDFGW